MPAQHRFYLPLQPRVLFGHPSTRQKNFPVASWRAQYLCRLTEPAFTPLGEPSIYPA